LSEGWYPGKLSEGWYPGKIIKKITKHSPEEVEIPEEQSKENKKIFDENLERLTKEWLDRLKRAYTLPELITSLGVATSRIFEEAKRATRSHFVLHTLNHEDLLSVLEHVDHSLKRLLKAFEGQYTFRVASGLHDLSTGRIPGWL